MAVDPAQPPSEPLLPASSAPTEFPASPEPFILLLGPRASGKSTLGGLLAQRRNVAFVDLDERVLSRFAEATVREVWARHGEQAWRGVEAEELRRVLAGPPAVVALGGGTPMIEQARRAIDDARARGRARTVLLLPPPHVLVQRLAAAPGDRPALTGDDLAQEAASVLARRLPTYRACADLEIDSSQGDPAAAAEELHRLLEARAK